MTHAQHRQLIRQREQRGLVQNLKLALIIGAILIILVIVEGCGAGGSGISPPASAASPRNMSGPARSLALTPTVEFMGDSQAQEIVAYANSSANPGASPLWRCSTCQATQLSSAVLAEVPAVIALHPDLVVVQTGAYDLEQDANERDAPLALNVEAIVSELTSAKIPVIVDLLPNPNPPALYDPYYFNSGMDTENQIGVIPAIFTQAGAQAGELLDGLDYTQAGLEIIYPLLQAEVEDLAAEMRAGGLK